ncbi:MAG: hypothetical protein S4CHLAM20_10930 [Chlamydiia bacterium]|nr:hypothetical protein [Chlamydiia bacterium]
MFLYFSFFCFFLGNLSAVTIDIVTDFWNDLYPAKLEDKSDKECQFRIINTTVEDYEANYFSSNVKYVIFFGQLKPNIIKKMPKEKLILFTWEPEGFGLNYYNLFYRIYTTNDNLIDNDRFFKFCYPYLKSFPKKVLPFNKKKLSAIVARDWIHERVKLLKFFNDHLDYEFDAFGSRFISGYKKLYRGRIPGSHSGNPKIKTLQNYRFSFCLENSNVPGYITEKIFASFAAGCVPIYLGPSNIDDYIPKDCYIDYRAFSNLSELYGYINNISELEYQTYLDNISKYCNSEQSKCFSTESFEKIFIELKNS